MKHFTLVLAGAAAALLTLGAATAEGRTTGTAACKSGNITYQGLRARAYCGPASATLKVDGRTLNYRGGSCIRNGVAVELGIGTMILDTKEPKGALPRSFGVSVGRIFGIGKAAPKDGTYSSVIVSYVDGGKRYAAMSGKAVLAGNRSRGSFAAKLFTGQTITGTFRCS